MEGEGKGGRGEAAVLAGRARRVGGEAHHSSSVEGIRVWGEMVWAVGTGAGAGAGDVCTV